MVCPGLPRHLLEEAHQVVRLGEVQAESDFLDGEIGEKQVVLVSVFAIHLHCFYRVQK